MPPFFLFMIRNNINLSHIFLCQIKKIATILVTIEILLLCARKTSMDLNFSSIFDAISICFQTREKINCFHCDEKMRKENALLVVFNGGSHPVCCHGCLAVLQTIERNGLTMQYLQAKSPGNMTESSQ